MPAIFHLCARRAMDKLRYTAYAHHWPCNLASKASSACVRTVVVIHLELDTGTVRESR